MKTISWAATGLALAGVIGMSYRGYSAGSSGTEKLTYTAEGRLASRTAPNGNTLRYEYDQSGRLSRIRTSLFSSIDFQYNAASDLVTVRSPSVTTQLRRDALGRISKVSWGGGKELTYEYDPWGRVISLAASNGNQVRYSRNILGQLTAMDDGHGRTTYAYSPHTVVRRLPDGVQTTFELLPSGRVSAITHRRADGALLASFGYSYRPDGKVSVFRSESARGQTTESYEYDLLGRLVAIADSDGNRTEYAYDAVGNRKSETIRGRTKSYGYDEAGRLVKSGSVTYKYDRSGNLLLRRDAATGKSTEYIYDADDRLVEVRGVRRVRYTYDGLGNRVGRDADGSISDYLNDSVMGLPKLFAVFDGAGRTARQYLPGDSTMGERDSTGETHYYLADRMGTVRYIVNSQGQIEKECKYSAFGQPLSSEDGDQPPSCGFDGEIPDSDTGLIYLRRRYYDPAIGRFISPDPYRGDLSSPRSLNRYAFASNDPINRRDPSGLQDDGGDGFSFNAPVINTGSAFSGSSLPEGFFENWAQGPVQYQDSNSGSSVIAAVKSALGNVFGFGTGGNEASPEAGSSAASSAERAGGAAEAAQSVGGAALSGLDLAALKYGDDFTKAISAKAGLLASGLGLAQGISDGDPIKLQDGATGLVGYGAGLASELAGGIFSGLGLAQGVAEAGLLASGVPQTQINLIKSSADRAALSFALPGSLSLLDSIGEFVSSGAAQHVIGDAGNTGLRTFGLDDPNIMFDAASGQPGPVGGVRLDKAAELIGTLGEISGAAYDPKTGRLVLVGEKNTTLPPMRLDDLGVALRAAYSGDPAEPSMTIDPDPRDPKGPSMNVVFFGGTANTHFGWVMFEADRVMKTYSVGRDNLTREPVQSHVVGYRNIVQLGEESGSTAGKPNLWSRFWLVPETIRLRVTSDGTGVVFDKTKIRVCTETMRWGGGRLVSANPSGAPKASSDSPCIPTSVKDDSAEYFAKHFSDNYEQFAGENTIYGELKRIAQVYALAKWMKKAGIPVDPQWVNSLASGAYETPRVTPSISNSLSRTWKAGAGSHTETHAVFGGTDLKAPVAFKWNDSHAENFAAAVFRTALSAEGDAEVSFEGRRFHAVALQATAKLDYGSFRTSSPDLLVGRPSGANLQVLRSYTSFHTAPTPFGHGWSMLLPHLYFVGVTAKGESRSMSVQGAPGTAVVLQQFHLADEFGNLNLDFTEHFIDQEWKLIGFRPKRPSPRYRGLYPNPDQTYSLMFANGDEWRFDRLGNLIAVRSSGMSVDYRFETGTTKLREVSSGSARIQFEYDGNGRITRAAGSNGRDVRYWYDTDSNLSGVQCDGTKIAYLYNRNHELTGQFLNGKKLWGNEYDSRGRLLRQLTAGKVSLEQKFEETADGGQRIVWTRDLVRTALTYDGRLRPIELTSGTNAAAYSYYPSGAFKSLRNVGGDGARIEVSASEDQRVFRSVDLRGTMREIRYDERGYAAQVSINGRPYATYTRDVEGRPVRTDYGAFQETYVYGADGRVAQYTLETPGPNAKSERVDLAYDQDGAITGIASAFGSVVLKRDPENRISLSAGGRTIRAVQDAAGRTVGIVGPDGDSVNYEFGPDQGLTGIAFATEGRTGTMTFREGRLSEQTDLNGGRTKYEYTRKGKLSAVIDTYGSATRYLYDGADRLIRVSQANGQKTVYVYDPNRHTLEVRGR